MDTKLVDMFGNPIDAKRPSTAGYDPGPRYLWFQAPRDLPIFTFRTIQYMLLDPVIRLGIAMRVAPLCAAEFAYKEQGQWIEGVQADKPEVKEFVEKQLKRLWTYDIDKVLTSQIWGWSACEVMWKKDEDGSYNFDTLISRHARDVRALTKNGMMTGIQFSRLSGNQKGQANLQVPGKAIWHSFAPDSDSFYGNSIMLGAYSPFADKWFNGGALDVRRLFMHADAYSGRRIWYPPGFTNIEGEGDVPNRDIARQMVEQIKSGEVQFLPSAFDERGNKLWNVEDPRVSNNPQHILQYPKDVDIEILRGLEIADDVITSQGSAGAWQGKQVPMQAFYSGLNRWGISVVRAVVKQIIEPAVMWKFRKAESFEATLKPLDVQAMEMQQGPQQPQGPQGPPGMPPGMPGQGPMAPPPGMGNSMADSAGLGGPQPGESPFTMSLDPEREVGKGVLSAAEMVRAARRVMVGEPEDKQSIELLTDRMDRILDSAVVPDNGSSITINTTPLSHLVDNANGKVKEFATTQVEIPHAKSAELSKLIMDVIDPADLGEKGFESNHHITVKCGLQHDGLQQATHILNKEPPVSARFGPLEFFANPDEDVLWVSVESPSLIDMNSRLSDSMPCTDAQPSYVPHMTLAYLKPGTARKYQGTDLMLGVQSFGSVMFSDCMRCKTPIALGGPMRMSSSSGEWLEYDGPRGGTGWRNTSTNEVVYQQDKPGGADAPSSVGEGEDSNAAAKSWSREDYDMYSEDEDELDDIEIVEDEDVKVPPRQLGPEEHKAIEEHLHNPRQSISFSGPGFEGLSLHGIPIENWEPPEDWTKVEGQNPNIDAPPMKRIEDKPMRLPMFQHPHGGQGGFATRKKIGGEQKTPKVSGSLPKWFPKWMKEQAKEANEEKGARSPSGHQPKPHKPASPRYKSSSAGCVIFEPDGRVWLFAPRGRFGGVDNSFPKGGMEEGLNEQQTAIKEVWEETGLKVDLVGFVGDYERTTTNNRYFIAKRSGGSPYDSGWEAESVKLVTVEDAQKMLNVEIDLQILEDALKKRPRRMSYARMAWQEYDGPRGGTGWRNADTGEIVYQENMPGQESRRDPFEVQQPQGEYGEYALPAKSTFSKGSYTADLIHDLTVGGYAHQWGGFPSPTISADQLAHLDILAHAKYKSGIKDLSFYEDLDLSDQAAVGAAIEMIQNDLGIEPEFDNVYWNAIDEKDVLTQDYPYKVDEYIEKIKNASEEKATVKEDALENYHDPLLVIDESLTEKTIDPEITLKNYGNLLSQKLAEEHGIHLESNYIQRRTTLLDFLARTEHENGVLDLISKGDIDPNQPGVDGLLNAIDAQVDYYRQKLGLSLEEYEKYESVFYGEHNKKGGVAKFAGFVADIAKGQGGQQAAIPVTPSYYDPPYNLDEPSEYIGGLISDAEDSLNFDLSAVMAQNSFTPIVGESMVSIDILARGLGHENGLIDIISLEDLSDKKLGEAELIQITRNLAVDMGVDYDELSTVMNKDGGVSEAIDLVKKAASDKLAAKSVVDTKHPLDDELGETVAELKAELQSEPESVAAQIEVLTNADQNSGHNAALATAIDQVSLFTQSRYNQAEKRAKAAGHSNFVAYMQAKGLDPNDPTHVAWGALFLGKNKDKYPTVAMKAGQKMALTKFANKYAADSSPNMEKAPPEKVKEFVDKVKPQPLESEAPSEKIVDYKYVNDVSDLLPKTGGEEDKLVQQRGTMHESFVAAIKGIAAESTGEKIRDLDISRVKEARQQYDEMLSQLEKQSTQEEVDKFKDHYGKWIAELESSVAAGEGSDAKWGLHGELMNEMAGEIEIGEKVGVSDKFTYIKTLEGGTHPHLVADADGKKFVRKTGGGDAHIKSEVLTDFLYQATGVGVPRFMVDQEGKFTKIAEFIEGTELKYLSASEREKADKEIRKDFVYDALFGNWDVIGLVEDNILVDNDGKVYRIDNGGSLRFRAGGKLKEDSQGNSLFTKTVNELDSMRDPSNDAGKVFGTLTDKEVAAQINDLLENHRHTILSAVAHDSELQDIMWGRLAYLEQWADAKKSDALPKPPGKASKFLDKAKVRIESIAAGSHFKPAQKAWIKIWTDKAVLSMQNAGISNDNIGKIVSAYLDGKEQVTFATIAPTQTTWKYAPEVRAKMLGMTPPTKKHEGKTMTVDQRIEWGQKVLNNATAAQRSSMKKYTGSYYITLNNMAWSCPETLDCLPDTDYNHLKKITVGVASVGPLPNDTRIYRGVKGEFGKGFVEDAKKKLAQPGAGKVMILNGGISATISPGSAAGWSGNSGASYGNVVFEIYTRSGAYVGPRGSASHDPSISSHGHEWEVIQGHGTMYRPLRVIENAKIGSSGHKHTIIQMEEVGVGPLPVPKK